MIINIQNLVQAMWCQHFEIFIQKFSNLSLTFLVGIVSLFGNSSVIIDFSCLLNVRLLLLKYLPASMTI